MHFDARPLFLSNVGPHHDALHTDAVALPQRLNQFGVLLLLPGVEPLLELIEDDEYLLAGRNALTPAEGRQRILQTQVGGQRRAAFPQAVGEPGLRLLGGGLDVDRDHLVGQARQQARFDQRRLAAPARPADQPDGERLVGIGFLDARLPETKDVGQPVPVTRAG